MRLEAFGACDSGGQWRDFSCSSGIERDQADDVDKIPDVEWGGEAGAAAGWHDMTWASDVIAKNFEGLLAHEDAARIGNLFAQRPGIVNG